MVLAASDDSAGAMITEDGFSVFIPGARWAEALAALESGRPFELASDKDHLPFAIEVGR